MDILSFQPDMDHEQSSISPVDDYAALQRPWSGPCHRRCWSDQPCDPNLLEGQCRDAEHCACLERTLLRKVNWMLPFHLMLLVTLFILVTATPTAIWAGALTPVSTTKVSNGQVHVPGYNNISNIREWPLETGHEGPILRNTKGLFSYSVGAQLQANLLNSASSATPADGSLRQHAKLNNPRFTYFGRSFGVGASIGLTDTNITNNDLHLAFTYQEIGFNTAVSCIYNTSTALKLIKDPTSSSYEIIGPLPNSPRGQPEITTYIGHTNDSIVGIEVAAAPVDDRRMLGIIAGSSYQNLNATQCTMTFTPTTFNVCVGVVARNITVTPIGSAPPLAGATNLTHVVMRQLQY